MFFNNRNICIFFLRALINPSRTSWPGEVLSQQSLWNLIFLNLLSDIFDNDDEMCFLIKIEEKYFKILFLFTLFSFIESLNSDK